MGRRTIALLALGLALTVAPLSPAAPPAGGTFRVAEPADYVSTIDAALSSGAGDVPWLSTTCASLMHVSDQSLPARVVPELAAAFPRVSADGKTYVFTIRKNARFSTGAPVTAADVAYTINRTLNPVLKSPNASPYQSIVGAQTVLDGKATSASGITATGNKLTIRLTRRVGDFVDSVATSLCVLPGGFPITAQGVTIGLKLEIHVFPAALYYSYFDSPSWNRALRQASRLTGPARYRAFGKLDVEITRDAAPGVAYSVDNTLTLVSARTGCVVVNPALDLAAVCLR